MEGDFSNTMQSRESGFQSMGILCFIAGVLLIIIGAFQGDASFGLILIIPFVVMHGPLPALGILLIFCGIVLFQFGFVDDIRDGFLKDGGTRGAGGTDTGTNQRTHSYNRGLGVEREGTTERGENIGNREAKNGRPALAHTTERGRRGKVRGGGIIFIGPIPIVFGDSISIRYLIPAAVALLILMIIAVYFL